MLGYFVLGVALLVGLLLIAKWYTTADPKTLARMLKWIGLVLVVALVAFLAFSGRLVWAAGAAFILLPWLMRARHAARMAKNFSRMAGSGASGQTSDVETRHLRMSLDHDSGTLDGEITAGAYAGRRLSGMNERELIDLLQRFWVEDAESARVLEAYLDRVHPDWRAGGGTDEWDASGDAAGRGGNGSMSREEAYEVLGLEPDTDEEAIKAAYHRLIAGLHPDKGGSTYLAAKINRAREVLLGR